MGKRHVFPIVLIHRARMGTQLCETSYTVVRSAFRILLKGGGGKIAVSAYQGGQVLHAVHYNIYIVKSQGGQTSSKGGGGGGGGLLPPPP